MSRTIAFTALASGSMWEIATASPSLDHALLLSSLALSASMPWAAGFLAGSLAELAACITACKAACAAVALCFAIFKVLELAHAARVRLAKGPSAPAGKPPQSTRAKEGGGPGLQEALEFVVEWVLPALALAVAVSVLAHLLRPNLNVSERDMTGRTAVITDAATPRGIEHARFLARCNAKVVQHPSCPLLELFVP